MEIAVVGLNTSPAVLYAEIELDPIFGGVIYLLPVQGGIGQSNRILFVGAVELAICRGY